MGRTRGVVSSQPRHDLCNLVRMADGFHLLEDVCDAAVAADDEGRPIHTHVFPSVERLLAPDAVQLAHGVVGVGDERKLVSVLRLEPLMLGDGVRADSDDLRAESLEPREGILETGCLDGSARGVVLRIEEQDHQLSLEVCERHTTAGVIQRRESGRLVSSFHARHLGFPMAGMCAEYLARRIVGMNHGWHSPDSRQKDTCGSHPDSSWVHWHSVQDRKSTRLNSSHANISYAVF